MGNKVPGAVKAPKSIKAGTAGGGTSGGTQWDPDPTVSGMPSEGTSAVSRSKKDGDKPMAGTNMQGAPGNPSATRTGEADATKGYATLAASRSSGKTDY